MCLQCVAWEVAWLTCTPSKERGDRQFKKKKKKRPVCSSSKGSYLKRIIIFFNLRTQLSFIVFFFFFFEVREALRSLPGDQRRDLQIQSSCRFVLIGPYCYLLKNAVLSHVQVSGSDLHSSPSNRGASEYVIGGLAFPVEVSMLNHLQWNWLVRLLSSSAHWNDKVMGRKPPEFKCCLNDSFVRMCQHCCRRWEIHQWRRQGPDLMELSI